MRGRPRLRTEAGGLHTGVAACAELGPLASPEAEKGALNNFTESDSESDSAIGFLGFETTNLAPIELRPQAVERVVPPSQMRHGEHQTTLQTVKIPMA